MGWLWILFLVKYIYFLKNWHEASLIDSGVILEFSIIYVVMEKEVFYGPFQVPVTWWNSYWSALLQKTFKMLYSFSLT